MFVPEAELAKTANFGERRISCAELLRRLDAVAQDYVFEGALVEREQAVLSGHFETVCLRPGLILHSAAVRDLCDVHTHNRLQPGIKILVVTGGLTDVAFGNRRFRLGTGGTEAALVNLAEEERFSRRWQRGREERKISLTLTQEWLAEIGLDETADSGGFLAFARQHLAFMPWAVSARARSLVQRLLQPAVYLPGLQRLYLEAHCVELASEALATLLPPVSTSDRLRPGERRRLQRLTELLTSDEVLGMSVADIARAVHSNPSSLQTLARKAWGRTVFEQLREIRLNKARQALLDGHTVAHAAEVAGYASATNFATAFKRRYGCSPRQCY
ncbi:hypothetical protein CAI21_15985 [Alkalilimnicola ehrlichii]|uniref:HTH araC/xylS-type domain-containing protein n=1 Tax=Alkalilimnicola ehrlichii TaxID=351052 RepID=A0A3E0WN97_9GAMM|nr:helix-turn-helix transcriptional regulator [Alkalilimnicola ehrlichii]RFA26785.1 hypothetical protein CAI21_15985 [Alkalilimnicola ehrlichii]RFA33879.1 hypothetical protein CAL65_16110 [Alkalilimnicola ehrlichii]